MKALTLIWKTILDAVLNKDPRWLEPDEGDMYDDDFYENLHNKVVRKTKKSAKSSVRYRSHPLGGSVAKGY